MSAAPPFVGFNPKPSPWGYNWVTTEAPPPKAPPAQVPVNQCPSPEPAHPMPDQYTNLPAALLNTLKREKKPFTYTPGGVNLSEVLNARLQKRIERKKKYSEERTVPPKQVMIMPTYNSPLDMYSMQNALETLEVQAGLVAADRSLSDCSLSAPSRSATLPRNHTFHFENDMDPGKGVSQSRAFKVLQIITDTEEDLAEKQGSHHRDEMRFTGIREKKADIPSKFFHTLQKITGTEDSEEEEQPRTGTVVRTFEKQQQPVSRPPFLAHQQAPVDRIVPPAQPSSAPAALKRPAAFLPIKTSPGFRPVQPPCLSNGPLRRNPAAGTDF